MPCRTDADEWRAVLAAARQGHALPPDWCALYGPIAAGAGQDPFVLAQLGQSLDGRIATSTGRSRYINGEACLVHLHRLRALVDIVIVGIGTVTADDPRLTVRLVEGESPARAVIDPRGRIPRDAKLLTDPTTDLVVVTSETAELDLPGFVNVVRLPTDDKGRLDPHAIRERLGVLGYRRQLVEGGAATVSAFLDAGCLDRLHLLVAPMIIGAGRQGLSLAPTDRLDAVHRPATTLHRLGDEVVFDCDFSGLETTA
ncbi:RibD family protein [Amorphus sp. 3PC139-8]